MDSLLVVSLQACQWFGGMLSQDGGGKGWQGTKIPRTAKIPAKYMLKYYTIS